MMEENLLHPQGFRIKDPRLFPVFSLLVRVSEASTTSLVRQSWLNDSIASGRDANHGEVQGISEYVELNAFGLMLGDSEVRSRLWGIALD